MPFPKRLRSHWSQMQKDLWPSASSRTVVFDSCNNKPSNSGIVRPTFVAGEKFYKYIFYLFLYKVKCIMIYVYLRFNVI